MFVKCGGLCGHMFSGWGVGCIWLWFCLCGGCCVGGVGMRFGLVFRLVWWRLLFLLLLLLFFVFLCRLCLGCIIYMSWMTCCLY